MRRDVVGVGICLAFLNYRDILASCVVHGNDDCVFYIPVLSVGDVILQYPAVLTFDYLDSLRFSWFLA